jgi:hypothetical protein
MFVIQRVRKVAVHLQKVLEVMSTSVYIGLNPFNSRKTYSTSKTRFSIERTILSKN